MMNIMIEKLPGTKKEKAKENWNISNFNVWSTKPILVVEEAATIAEMNSVVIGTCN